MQPTVKLNNGTTMPLLGLGTWLADKSEVAKAVKEALHAGYRMIDCSWINDNEAEIGQGIAEFLKENSAVKREHLFVISKVWNTMHRPECVQNAIEMSLANFKLDYLDLYLINWPTPVDPKEPIDKASGALKPDKKVTIKDTWRGMEQVLASGRARAIGVSNFSHDQMVTLLADAKVKPAVLQVELHPYLTQPELTGFCKENGIVVQAYSPLGGSPDRPAAQPNEPSLKDDPVVLEIAKKHNCDPCSVLLRFHLDRGCSVVVKSTNPDNIKQNLSALDFRLDSQELDRLEGLNRNYRFVDFFMDQPNYPFGASCCTTDSSGSCPCKGECKCPPSCACCHGKKKQ